MYLFKCFEYRITYDIFRLPRLPYHTKGKPVHGSVKDSQGDLFAEKHIYFYENEDDSDYCPVASGFINSNGEYGLYLETGKTYYVKIYKYENYKEIYLPAGSITISGQGKYDLRASN